MTSGLDPQEWLYAQIREEPEPGEDLVDRLRELMAAGADPCRIDASREVSTPMMLAARLDRWAWVAAFMANGCDPSASGSGGLTPAMLALQCGHRRYLRALLSHGLDPDDPLEREHETRRSLLQIAAFSGETGMVALLLDHGASMSYRDAGDGTVVHRAARHPQVLALLQERGADLEVNTATGMRAAHLAAIHGSVKAFVWLAEEGGVDLNAPDGQGRTPLSLAQQHESLETVARTYMARAAARRALAALAVKP